MAYWWVSQNKTWKHEISGGYMWAPNRDSAGRTPFHWATMNEVQAGDVVFSFVKQRIRAVGVAKGRAADSSRPIAFSDTVSWEREGKRIDVAYENVNPPLPVASVAEELRALLPTERSPLNVNNTGNQGYLFALPPRAGRFLLEHARGADGHRGTDLVEEALKQTVPDVTERDAIVKSRVGQGRYRKDLLAKWKSCAVTGLDVPELLRASHIKPWSDCNDRERVDAYNGFLLSPAYDAAFDAGLISFGDDGRIIISAKLSVLRLAKLGISADARISSLKAENLAYLAYHRRERLRSGTKDED